MITLDQEGEGSARVVGEAPIGRSTGREAWAGVPGREARACQGRHSPLLLPVPAWASRLQGRHAPCAGMLLRPDASPPRNGLWPNRVMRRKAPPMGLGKQIWVDGLWIGKFFFNGIY